MEFPGANESRTDAPYSQATGFLFQCYPTAADTSAFPYAERECLGGSKWVKGWRSIGSGPFFLRRALSVVCCT